ncbi:response regulator [Bdellovibrio sp. HCB337]|uniref:response regulator n=1 Tax=Bdellovibrio sp. HCB337 TaxID=3394358 RepID=UPI0039A58E9A
MKKILLVEDDDAFRSALQSTLSKKLYEVIEAPNGKIARELLATTTVDLVISDIQMPHCSGVDLLEWIKKNKPVPVILMTGFSHILETQRAHDLGAEEFLAKPFKEEELLANIEKLIGKEEQPAENPLPNASEDLDKEFCKLPIEDFITEKETDYGIYLRMSNTKYIKIAHKGGKLSQDKINAFKSKGVTHLFIRQEDFYKLVGFTLLVSKAVSSSGQVDKTKKMRFMQYTGEMVMQQAFVTGTDEALFRNAKDFLTTSMEILTEDEETFTLLNLLSNHTDYLYAHSLGVSTFSVMIAKQLGWQSPQTLFKLAFAGLFHDIGKKEIPEELLLKPRSTLTQHERALLETHTTRGMEILQSLKTAPTEVIQVAYEHHEDVLGQGFPQGLTKIKLHPFTLIVSVANVFCEYTIKGPQNPAPRTATAAIQAMQTFKLASLDTQSFEALKKVVHSIKDVA